MQSQHGRAGVAQARNHPDHAISDPHPDGGRRRDPDQVPGAARPRGHAAGGAQAGAVESRLAAALRVGTVVVIHRYLDSPRRQEFAVLVGLRTWAVDLRRIPHLLARRWRLQWHVAATSPRRPTLARRPCWRGFKVIGIQADASSAGHLPGHFYSTLVLHSYHAQEIDAPCLPRPFESKTT